MKRIFIALLSVAVTASLFYGCTNIKASDEKVSYYEVPLVCGAAPSIGCGSRIKPLFMDTEKEKSIKESWTNRQGTVIAIVWNENENEKVIQSLFAKNGIDAKLVYDSTELKMVAADFKVNGKWLKGMEVDQLSIEEAGVIAKSLTQFAEDAKIISHEECMSVRKDLENYFKKELVKIRTEEELGAVKEQWMKDGYAIYEKHLGKEKADAVSELYFKEERIMKMDDSCCDKKEGDEDCCKKKKETSMVYETSEITCPKCGHKKTEKLPTDVCVIHYTCEKCHADLTPKVGDCCVFCTYGTHKCPSKQV
jgi:hypothetical protein